MLVDCSDGKTVKMDPEAYPTGVVLRIVRRLKPEFGGVVPAGPDDAPLPGFEEEQWTAGQRTPMTYWRQNVSLSDFPGIEEEASTHGEARFIVSSLYRGGDDETLWVERELGVSLVHYPDGWVLELYADDSPEIQIPLPKFDPRAKMSGNQPPGRPIWDRLNEEG